MIIGFIVACIVFLFTKLIGIIVDFLPEITIPSFTLPYTVQNIFSWAQYFLPMNTVLFGIGATCLLTVFRCGVALFRFVKSFIPGISGGG